MNELERDVARRYASLGPGELLAYYALASRLSRLRRAPALALERLEEYAYIALIPINRPRPPRTLEEL